MKPWGDGTVVMLGIGGCGMSGLARMLRSAGVPIWGSDSVPSPVTDRLIGEGFLVELSQDGPLPPDAGLVIATAAIKPDNPAIVEAKRRGLEIITYPQALGRLMQGRSGVAIAGTHGKSTTTAMLGAALVDAGLDPSVIVGATCAQLGAGALGGRSHAPTGFRVGASRTPRGAYAGRPGLLLAEACEFNRSFHNLAPLVASISAVEADHLDIYGSLDAVVEAFAGFAQRIAAADEGGVLLIGHEGAHRREVASACRARVETIGFAPSADWRVGFDEPAGRIEIAGPRAERAAWTCRMPGVHNAMNSATAFALGAILGADCARLAESLGAFAGLGRRMEFLGERPMPAGGVVRVYDDYGHHPTEVDATLRALRAAEDPGARGGRLVCVFQPHQHSRTRFLLDEFASAFGHADVVIVPEIYFVRDSEAEKHRVSSIDLVQRLRQRGVRAMRLDPFEAIVEHLDDFLSDGDLLVVMGAGPVWKVAHGFMGTAVQAGAL
ncbi:MAG: UDP-N-acetylmuramate--L-alanine ligase [Phycisphaerales bacterium JB039]